MAVINYSEIESKLKIDWIQVGQKRAYGDSLYIADIINIDPDNALTTEQVEEYMRDVMSHSKTSKAEYDSKPQSMAKYFNGYYTLTPTDYGWRFWEIQPYDD